MRNVLRILGRDMRRLLGVPMAWVIAIALMILPSTYAWVNVLGFWDPYGNTSQVRVSVADSDAGADVAPVGKLDLGAQIVGELKGNHDLGWAFVPPAQAMDDVESGRSYAAIVIPQDFSESLGALLTGGGKRPTLEYYVNEKASPIAPKVTDTAAGTVDTQINDTFVATVAKVVAGAVNDAARELGATGDSVVGDVTGTLASVRRDVADARKSATSLGSLLKRIPDQTASARQALDTVRTLGGQADDALGGVAGLIDQAGSTADGLAGQVGGALATGTGYAGQALGLAHQAVGTVTGSLQAANDRMAGLLDPLAQANDEVADVLGQLQGQIGLAGVSAVIDRLQGANQTLGTLLTDLTDLNNHLGGTVDDAAGLGDDLDAALRGALDTANDAQTRLTGTALPKLDSALDAAAGTATDLGGRLAGQSSLLDQAGTVLDQLDRTAATATTAIERTTTALDTADRRLATLATDLNALAGANAVERLVGEDHLDAAAIAGFMDSPTVLDTHELYPVNSYGSGMAPLFTSLALWAGAFMLVVIFKLETDDEGITGMTPAQGYLGRWLFLAILAACQGLVATVGDLVIGVQTASPFLFVATGVITALVDIAIAYALSTTFLHVGKALCVILIVIQIPGASGLYPIEMMPGFFRTLYPFFPFSHSITAMRETIGGFYDGHWLREVGILLAFAAGAFVVGLGLRPWLANVNRLFAREIAEGDLINGEPVRLRGRGLPIGPAIRVLSDRAEYKAAISRRAAAFADLYPRLKRGALVVGLAVPAILTIAFSLTTNTKLEALGSWTVLVLLVIAFLLAIETVRDRMRRQVELGNLDDAAIRGALAERERGKEAARQARRDRRERRRRTGRRHRPGHRSQPEHRDQPEHQGQPEHRDHRPRTGGSHNGERSAA